MAILDLDGEMSHSGSDSAVFGEEEPRVKGLHPGTPFYAIGLMPLFWFLGLGFFTFAIAAVPMAFVLLAMKPIRMPKGFGIWLLFIGWMLVSAVTLEPTVNRYLSFTLRAGTYIGATIIFLYIYNLPRKYLPTGRVLGMIAGIFVFTAIIGGYLGLLLGETSIPTLMSFILPRSMLSNDFVRDVVQPPFAQTQDFLGFPLNRPSFPYSFSNDWAATLVPATFASIAAAGHMRRGRAWLPVLGALALVPMVVSVNRGMWIALIAGLLYFAGRRALRGNLILAGRLLGVMVVAGALIMVSPLGEIITQRATTEHSVEARGDLYTDVLEALPESPVLGFGAPLANDNPNRPAVGTHGMLWTALFSQGVPGGVLYLVFWAVMTIRTGLHARTQEQLLLHLAVASSLPTMLYYDHLPAALPIMMMVLAVFFRDKRDDDIRRKAVLESSLVAP